MNPFEAQLIALAEMLAEQLLTHLVAKLENKLGLPGDAIQVPPQAQVNANVK